MDVEELVSPASAALIVVDMQNDFCSSDGLLASYGNDPSMIQEMAPRLRRMLAVAREVRLPIVHVRTHHSPWTNSPSWLGRHSRDVRHCFPGTWGADWYEGCEPILSEDWAPRQHEFVVTKHRYSGFVNTDLDLILRSHGIRSVIMAGEATNVCVESTARDAYMRDYFVAFLSDCTATGTQAAHDATLYTMGKHFGKVLTSDEVVAAWERSGVLRREVAAAAR